MQLAKTIGTATATIKHQSLQGEKLAIVQPLTSVGKADGFPLIAVDTVGSSLGDEVFITSDGAFSRNYLSNENTSVRWTVVGIKD